MKVDVRNKAVAVRHDFCGGLLTATRGALIIANCENQMLTNVRVMAVFFDDLSADSVRHCCNFFLN